MLRIQCAAIGVSGFATMTRSFLKAVARGLVGVVLATQMLIAAYACPSLALPAATAMQMPDASISAVEQSSANADMSAAQAGNCDDMAGALDPAAPNLCAEHCKYGQQSDHAPTLNAPAVVLAALYSLPLVPVTAPPPRPAAATLSALVAASPPHAILHCVHRI
ncbi:hypothetical protein MW290_32715 (plasmid) [Aquincola tertiaricarbonis]|uniref:Uncharacterized protein n=1 Tax=Aquincola tertiaricarbonis TaxID=391953 RepID=A0ABY4SF98_AQUTE|nr:hypothetical protein [Aquincola tertiaricarbonis]URI12008.1 hypothetical protein MW290_32715 [Aquincola tertiaricarbonis]